MKVECSVITPMLSVVLLACSNMAPIQPVTRDVYDQSMFTVSTSHSDAVDSKYYFNSHLWSVCIAMQLKGLHFTDLFKGQQWFSKDRELSVRYTQLSTTLLLIFHFCGNICQKKSCIERNPSIKWFMLLVNVNVTSHCLGRGKHDHSGQ